MQHISKFDGCVYEISYSVTMEDGEERDDDITLIWRDAQCDFDDAEENDIPLREFIGWYFGEYNFAITEQYVKDYYKKKLMED